MSRSVIQVSVPSTEIVTSADMSPMLHGYPANEEAFLTMTIAAARDHVEGQTGYSLSPRDFVQYCDRFPMQPGMASLVPVNLFYPTGLNPYNRRNPFEIELLRNPGLAISKIVYVDITGTLQTLNPGTDFAADLTSTPARVTPLPVPVGSSTGKAYWPACLPGPKAVAIYYTAGFYTVKDQLTTETQVRDMGYPLILKAVVMALAEKWFINRDNFGEVPKALQDLMFSNRVPDFIPTNE